MSVQLSPVTILTEDWYHGYTPRDERFTVDADFELEEDEYDAYCVVTEDMKRNYDAELAFLHRDEDDNSILMRWNQPDDVLDALEQIELNDERAVWVERMTAFRETQLRRLLREYFGSEQYMEREMVLRWHQVNDRWTPAEKIIVRDWVAQQIEERGSRLAAFSACAGTIRSKMARKRVAKTGEAWWKTYNAV